MIISRTPLRISFAGGGSDLPAFYQEAGAVVSTAIDKYVYITLNRKFDQRIRASYSVTEIVDRVSELKHELIRESMILTGIDKGIEITSISDVPSEGSGLGSSSSYTVGLLNALYALKGHHVGEERLAREACLIEMERCGKPIGKQDQYIGAYGGFKYIQFNPDGSVFVDPIICQPETRQKVEEGLLLLYTGVTRRADDILREQQTNVQGDEANRRGHRAVVQLARQLREALSRDDVTGFGEVLHWGWLEKRKLASGITNQQIDEWYDRARGSGAIGGKVLGAGGGGFLLLYAPPERHREIVDVLPELRPVHIQLEPQGSKIIYYDEDRDSRAALDRIQVDESPDGDAEADDAVLTRRAS